VHEVASQDLVRRRRAARPIFTSHDVTAGIAGPVRTGGEGLRADRLEQMLAPDGPAAPGNPNGRGCACPPPLATWSAAAAACASLNPARQDHERSRITAVAVGARRRSSALSPQLLSVIDSLSHV
jgi:hypothetical protein